MQPKSVLIVDDNVAIRRVVRYSFESQQDFQICGEAVNGQDAIEKAKQFKPDLIILDFAMPVLDGIEAAAILSQIMPSIRLILFTMHSNAVVNVAARTAGISAVIAKEHGLEELLSQSQKLLGLSSRGRSLARGI